MTLETSTLDTNSTFICITSVCKLKVPTLKQTFRQNHLQLAHFYKICFFYEKKYSSKVGNAKKKILVSGVISNFVSNMIRAAGEGMRCSSCGTDKRI